MLLSESDEDNAPVKSYVLGNEYIGLTNGTEKERYYIIDEQGSIRYVLNDNSEVESYYQYDAFGETIIQEGTRSQLQYNSQIQDELSGLYYLRARYYNPRTGRFTQEDVIYNDGLNLYAYCKNNPVIYSDPSGFNSMSSGCDSKSGSTNANPYAYLEDGPNVGPGKDFTKTQKEKMLAENRKRNGGVVKADNLEDYYEYLTKPQKSRKGVSPRPNEWQFDHIVPKSKGGTNSYSNCQIVSRKYNWEKSNK